MPGMSPMLLTMFCPMPIPIKKTNNSNQYSTARSASEKVEPSTSPDTAVSAPAVPSADASSSIVCWKKMLHPRRKNNLTTRKAWKAKTKTYSTAMTTAITSNPCTCSVHKARRVIRTNARMQRPKAWVARAPCAVSKWPGGIFAMPKTQTSEIEPMEMPRKPRRLGSIDVPSTMWMRLLYMPADKPNVVMTRPTARPRSCFSKLFVTVFRAQTTSQIEP
mmetsp:Transcript_23201/g.59195  ORF Transcript_23201/g.59195 Transcript_23201/m.59195 type:complete len:219 (+) Transcript_23201:811-1467(+)